METFGQKLVRKFHAAFHGLKLAWTEQSFRIEVCVAIIAFILSYILPIGGFKRGVVIFIIALVLSLEVVNTMVEKLLDFLEPQFNSKVKHIKDMSSASVFIAALAAAIIGLAIFLPYVIDLLF